MGLEILALWLVFKASFRAQSARTYVRVTAETVTVRKVDGWGPRTPRQAGLAFCPGGARPRRAWRHALRLAASDKAYPLGDS